MLKIKKRKAAEYIAYSLIILLGIVIDQITKQLAVKYLSPIDTKPLWEGVLHLTYVENDGAAFGMLDDNRILFMLPSTVMIIGMSLYLYLGYAENRIYAYSVAAIVSGGIGNMIDRIALGYVVDFIDFRLINFAVFNGADAFVCVGAGFLMLALILDLVKEIKAAKNKNADGDVKNDS